MWIEIIPIRAICGSTASHATYVACGLKFRLPQRPERRDRGHATYVACGLKSEPPRPRAEKRRHATYVACGLKFVVGVEDVLALEVMPRMWHVD